MMAWHSSKQAYPLSPLFSSMKEILLLFVTPCEQYPFIILILNTIGFLLDLPLLISVLARRQTFNCVLSISFSFSRCYIFSRNGFTTVSIKSSTYFCCIINDYNTAFPLIKIIKIISRVIFPPSDQQMETRLLTLSLVIFIFLNVVSSQHFKKVINTLDPEAKCLDGSPPIYYIHQGLAKSNFIIWFYGGGFFGSEDISSTIQSAYQRSKTLLGSSLNWPDTQNGGGYLSANPLKNKFAEWTKIMVPYCDGALHQGYAKDPIRYKDATIYFRGSKITKSLFDSLNSLYGFYNSSKIVLTGASAGGIATFVWSNYLRSKLTFPDALYTIPDTGVFLNVSTEVTNKYLLSDCIINTFKFANIDELTPNQACNQKFPGEEYKCLFFEYASQTLEGRVLLLESQYDFFSIMFIKNIQCPAPGKVYYTLEKCNNEQMRVIEAYKSTFLEVLSQKYLQASEKNSLWAIACSGHGFGASDSHYENAKEKVPELNGKTARDAVEKFIFSNQRVISMDINPWPLNKPCAY